MRKLYFLVPGTTRQFGGGGLWAELGMVALAQKVCDAHIATYHQREKDTAFLDDLLQQQPDDCIFVMSWGFHVPMLVKKLRGRNVVYRAHSAGYRFSLPSDIPILAVSRNTLGYWGQHAINGLLYYLPNHISDDFRNSHQKRDIDVLVQTRKSSDYLLKQLVPALQPHCQVMVLEQFVEDLVGLFNRTKIYLYDSAEYWGQHGVSEGFGLPPMEAMACGCQVFSSVNGALADYLDPGMNCHKIGAYSTAFDVQCILQVLNMPIKAPVSEDFFSEYRTESIVNRLQVIVPELNAFFDHRRSHPPTIPALTRSRLIQLFIRRVRKKLGW
ncbi:MAG: glycosyltransferase [Cyanobacteria bacterium P01_E01_bin.6]